MFRLSSALLVTFLLAREAVHCDTRVLVDHGRVSIRAESAPLDDVLTRFARATGTEVVYQAARPRQPVSVVIEAGSAAEAIVQLLEGQGLNYALRLDPTGRNVEMLVVTGSVGPTADAGPPRAVRPGPPARPPDEGTEPEEVDPPFTPDAAEDPAISIPPGTLPDDAANPAFGSPGSTPGVAPGPETPFPAAPEPGQPQPPVPASYPGSVPVSPPAPPPVFPSPASYPGSG